jgi:hypothetical protein
MMSLVCVVCVCSLGLYSGTIHPASCEWVCIVADDRLEVFFFFLSSFLHLAKPLFFFFFPLGEQHKNTPTCPAPTPRIETYGDCSLNSPYRPESSLFHNPDKLVRHCSLGDDPLVLLSARQQPSQLVRGHGVSSSSSSPASKLAPLPDWRTTTTTGLKRGTRKKKPKHQQESSLCPPSPVPPSGTKTPGRLTCPWPAANPSSSFDRSSSNWPSRCSHTHAHTLTLGVQVPPEGPARGPGSPPSSLSPP